MGNKTKIIERLIEEKHITVEEAVVLLKEVHYSGTFQPAVPYKQIGGRIDRNDNLPKMQDIMYDNTNCMCGGNYSCKRSGEIK